MGLLDSLFGERLGVGLQLASHGLAAGGSVRARVILKAPPSAPATVRLARLHLQAVTWSLAHPAPPGAPDLGHAAHEPQPPPWPHAAPAERVQEKRDVAPPVAVCENLPVPAAQTWWRDLELAVPAGLPPTALGHVEYLVTLWAIVEGQLVDSVESVPVIVSGAHAPAPFAHAAAPPVAHAPEAPPAYAPGASCLAPSPAGALEPAMVVECRGAVTLVQWADGRPATWVRTAEIARRATASL